MHQNNRSIRLGTDSALLSTSWKNLTLFVGESRIGKPDTAARIAAATGTEADR